MSILSLKSMFEANLKQIIELGKDISNEDALNKAMTIYNAYVDTLKSFRISKCGYEGLKFCVYYEDGRVETI